MSRTLSILACILCFVLSPVHVADALQNNAPVFVACGTILEPNCVVYPVNNEKVLIGPYCFPQDAWRDAQDVDLLDEETDAYFQDKFRNHICGPCADQSECVRSYYLDADTQIGIVQDPGGICGWYIEICIDGIVAFCCGGCGVNEF